MGCCDHRKLVVRAHKKRELDFFAGLVPLVPCKDAVLLWRRLSSLHCNIPSVGEKNHCIARKLFVGLPPNLAGAMLKTRGRSSALLLQFGCSGCLISIRILQTLHRALLPLSQNMDSATLPLKPIMWPKVVLQQVLSFLQQSHSELIALPLVLKAQKNKPHQKHSSVSL